MTEEEVKNKLKTLTLGKHSDRVLNFMAKTFKSLASYAKWDEKKEAEVEEPFETETPDKEPGNMDLEQDGARAPKGFTMHYNIQIHLPDSRDPAVYDALFKSLRRHLF